MGGTAEGIVKMKLAAAFLVGTLVILGAVSGAPAWAGNIVVEEILRMESTNGQFPPQLAGTENFLEELNVLSLDDYKLFPLSTPDEMGTTARAVQFLATDIAHRAICTEAKKLLFQMGPEGFRRQVMYGMMQPFAKDSDGDMKITGEAVIAFHIAKLQFECVRPF
jgi:hypothetical protein